MVESVQVSSSHGRSDWQSSFCQQGGLSHAYTQDHHVDPRRDCHCRLLGSGRFSSPVGNLMSRWQIDPASRPTPGSRRPGDPLPGRFAGAFRVRIRPLLLPMAGKQSHHETIVPAAVEPPQLGRSTRDPYSLGSKTFQSIGCHGRRGKSPLFIIDSHPVDVCRPIRAGKKKRLGGLAKHGYCASLKRWFHGVREHLLFTPQGRIACVIQIPGNRHDVNGLYALLKTNFEGHLLGDNAYWPKENKRSRLAKKNITVTAATRSNWHVQNPPEEQALLDAWRGSVERRIGLFGSQFYAGRTLCRSPKHYHARRWFKVFSHNLSRHLNTDLGRPEESLMHYHLAS